MNAKCIEPKALTSDDDKKSDVMMKMNCFCGMFDRRKAFI